MSKTIKLLRKNTIAAIEKDKEVYKEYLEILRQADRAAAAGNVSINMTFNYPAGMSVRLYNLLLLNEFKVERTYMPILPNQPQYYEYNIKWV